MSPFPHSVIAMLCTLPKVELQESETFKFSVEVDGLPFHGFIIRYKGQLFAYENACGHLSVTLDAEDGDFLSLDRKQIQCHLHGALYEMDTGLCTGGPCTGTVLKKLPLRETATDWLITLG